VTHMVRKKLALFNEPALDFLSLGSLQLCARILVTYVVSVVSVDFRALAWAELSLPHL
jgi:hypothetical protein